ncbi:MAG: bacillithiol biosynthesis cysteine-adding enzyme BshC [Crocinitomicaceae bacterium]|nr:bacillithiol biosynthesis cysteine-adding enzyme BshC [Crocinitomicaceae bacterium]
MQKFTFKRQDTGLFTDQQLNLACHQERLLPFINRVFSKENFEQQIALKKQNFSDDKRAVLVAVLSENYAKITTTEKVKNTIDALKESTTFTVTTGHQLSLFTGPIYFIYKILHVIRLAEELALAYPENKFVPVFWMASEDHDFEEIQSIQLFNQQITWDTAQKGPVGRFELTDFEVVKNTVKTLFSSHSDNEIDVLMDAYAGENLAEATFSFVNALFQKYGLVIVDGDHPSLKQEFAATMRQELEHQFSYHAVQKTNEVLQKEGYKLQVNAREINLFYLQEQARERILHVEDGFYIEGKGTLSKEYLLEELANHPDRFSPNVILRPLYQETILPNLCYVGGVGEMAYWLQLKGVFDAVNEVYPLIQVRSSLLYIDPATAKKMDKVSMNLTQLFEDVAVVKKAYLKEFAADDVDFSSIEKQMLDLKSSIIEKVMSADFNLEKYAIAETLKLEKQVASIQEKVVKSVKQRHETALKTIEQVNEKLFPDNGMQERSLNLFQLCNTGKVAEIVTGFYKSIDPFDPDFVILRSTAE